METLFTDPSVNPIIRAALPNAKSSRTVKVRAATQHQIYSWPDRSRTYTYFVELATLRTISASALRHGTPQGLAMARVELPPGYAVVEHVILRSKDLGYCVVFHPDNIA